MYFEFYVGLDNMSEISKQRAFAMSFFLEAPSKKAILNLVDKGVIKKVNGDCIGGTHIDKIEMGVRRKFRAGDPIEFWGTPVEITERPDTPSRYLKVKISDDVFFCSFISPYLNSRNCFFLRLI